MGDGVWVGTKHGTVVGPIVDRYSLSKGTYTEDGTTKWTSPLPHSELLRSTLLPN